jgi:hypothetical protein
MGRPGGDACDVMPITDGWGIGTAEAVRIGGMSAAPRTSSSASRATDLRRFRVEHALRAIEDAMALLRGVDVHGVELRALARVRADLEVVLRLAGGEPRR